MADSIDTSALRAEIGDALAVIEPQIRGLHDLTTVSITPDLVQAINGEIAVRERRHALLEQIISDLNKLDDDMAALQADGYPLLPVAQLPQTLFSELRGEETDLDAAVGVFMLEQAASISVSLGSPAEKSTDEPANP